MCCMCLLVYFVHLREPAHRLECKYKRLIPGDFAATRCKEIAANKAVPHNCLMGRLLNGTLTGFIFFIFAAAIIFQNGNQIVIASSLQRCLKRILNSKHFQRFLQAITL